MSFAKVEQFISQNSGNSSWISISGSCGVIHLARSNIPYVLDWIWSAIWTVFDSTENRWLHILAETSSWTAPSTSSHPRTASDSQPMEPFFWPWGSHFGREYTARQRNHLPRCTVVFLTCDRFSIIMPFFQGVEASIRKDVWKYLLAYYDWSASLEERKERRKQSAYEIFTWDCDAQNSTMLLFFKWGLLPNEKPVVHDQHWAGKTVCHMAGKKRLDWCATYSCVLYCTPTCNVKHLFWQRKMCIEPTVLIHFLKGKVPPWKWWMNCWWPTAC